MSQRLVDHGVNAILFRKRLSAYPGVREYPIQHPKWESRTRRGGVPPHLRQGMDEDQTMIDFEAIKIDPKGRSSGLLGCRQTGLQRSFASRVWIFVTVQSFNRYDSGVAFWHHQPLEQHIHQAEHDCAPECRRKTANMKSWNKY